MESSPRYGSSKKVNGAREASCDDDSDGGELSAGELPEVAKS